MRKEFRLIRLKRLRKRFGLCRNRDGLNWRADRAECHPGLVQGEHRPLHRSGQIDRRHLCHSGRGSKIGNQKRFFDEKKATRLRDQGWGQIRIARELSVHLGQIYRWAQSFWGCGLQHGGSSHELRNRRNERVRPGHGRGHCPDKVRIEVMFSPTWHIYRRLCRAHPPRDLGNRAENAPFFRP